MGQHAPSCGCNRPGTIRESNISSVSTLVFISLVRERPTKYEYEYIDLHPPETKRNNTADFFIHENNFSG